MSNDNEDIVMIFINNKKCKNRPRKFLVSCKDYNFDISEDKLI